MASQFTVYKKKEEDLDEYSGKGGARKKKAKAATLSNFYFLTAMGFFY